METQSTAKKIKIAKSNCYIENNHSYESDDRVSIWWVVFLGKENIRGSYVFSSEKDHEESISNDEWFRWGKQGKLNELSSATMIHAI